MQFGSLDFLPVREHLDLVADTVRAAIERSAEEILAAPIDPAVADTAAFCERYGLRMEDGANCVIVEGRRADVVRHAVCLVLATDKVDVNATIRRLLDVKKVSFAGRDSATALTGMEFGGITPIGVPTYWPLFVDEAVAASGPLVVGSGLRRSKLLVRGEVLGGLPNARVLPIVKRGAPAA
ncbi:MAG TPA: YbaK/EbsC family protein [Naasia sp.]|jgi:prolyl-tRNA editing enzyme YbaK/EbsC (Cys-tRNA(Pro) deacylase)